MKYLFECSNIETATVSVQIDDTVKKLSAAFDYAFDGYSDFDTFDEYDSDGYVVKEKKFTNAKFQNARKQYIKSYKALLKIVK